MAKSQSFIPAISLVLVLCSACFGADWYQTKDAIFFEDFERLKDWTVLNGTAVADTGHVKTGSQSIKLTTGANRYAEIIKNVNLTISDSNFSGCGFWVYVEDVTKIYYIRIYLFESTTQWSTYMCYTDTLPAVGAELANGWNFIAANKKDWTSSGGAAWTDTFRRIDFKVFSYASQQAVVSFDSFYSEIYTRPKCSIEFDDGEQTVYTTAKPIMDAAGFKGTCNIITSKVGTANAMTAANLRELYDDGWDMCNHTRDHIPLDYLDEPNQEYEIGQGASDLRNMGFTRNDCYRHLVYPSGHYNADTFTACAAQGVLTGRYAGGMCNWKVMGFTDPYVMYGPCPTSSTDVSTITGYIDTAIANGEVLRLVFHRICDDVSGTAYSAAKFQQVIDYLSARRDQIDVVTLSEWYAGLQYKKIEAAPTATPSFGEESLTVQFAANASCPNCPNNTILTYAWDFDDPLSGDNNSTLENPTHIFDQNDVYNVELDISNGFVTTSYSIPVRVDAGPPEAAPTATPSFGKAPLTVQFAANASCPNCPNNTILTYAWDFGDPLSSDNSSTLENPTHIYDQNGVYNVELDVSNEFFTTSYSITIRVDVALPEADPTVTPSFGETPLAVQFAANAFCPNCPNNITLTYAWDFGDPSSSDDNSTFENPTHIYDQNGVYNVELDVSNGLGAADYLITIKVGTFVDYVMLGKFVNAYLSESGDQNYDSDVDFDSNNYIDLYDFAMLADYWETLFP